VLPQLLNRETPAGVAVLKPGFVYRVDGVVAKLYGRSSSPLARLREPRALRAVRSHARLLPVRSPQPLHWDRLRHERFESLLVYEFVEGPTLLDLWRSGEPTSLAALPRLFADLHAVGVLHADLHAKNLIWSAEGWYVLDLDGVRHGLHALRCRAITEKVWARLLLDLADDPAAEELYREFLRLAGRPWDAEPSWARIQKGFDGVLRKRGLTRQERGRTT
jgi:tRNA A-37 threonylcarbamoyl transferase component Bud32